MAYVSLTQYHLTMIDFYSPSFWKFKYKLSILFPRLFSCFSECSNQRYHETTIGSIFYRHNTCFQKPNPRCEFKYVNGRWRNVKKKYAKWIMYKYLSASITLWLSSNFYMTQILDSLILNHQHFFNYKYERGKKNAQDCLRKVLHKRNI